MASLVPRPGAAAGAKDDEAAAPPAGVVGALAMEQAYRRGLHPTPSPLRRMEDPCQDHIMPSRKDKKKKDERALMPPPTAPPSRRRGRQPPPQLHALDEDTFVDAIGEIIERDFFPELPKLHRQMKWLEALESKRLRSLTEVRRVVQAEMGRDDEEEEGGGARPAAGSATPLSTTGLGDEEEDDGESEVPPLPLSLDQFLARFQSEDDAAFDVLAERMREAHKRKYWWVYDRPAIEAGKEKLYLLPDGSFMSEEARLRHVEASNAKPRLGDDRPNAPETWPYRSQNQLMFLPASLEENAKVHQRGVHGATQPMLMLEGEGGGGGNGTLLLTAGGGSNARVGQAAKAPKAVVHSNTRFAFDSSSSSRGKVAPSPLERMASELSTLSSDTSASVEQAQATDGFVPMTPLLIPGAEGDVPLMTWGEVDSTPMRIPEPFDTPSAGMLMGSSGRSSGFRIQAPTHREKVATSLEAKARKKTSSSGGGKRPQPSPMLVGSSKKRGLGSLTPAAQSLAAKIALQGGGGGGKEDSAFGGGVSSQLRASYTGSGARRPSSTREGGAVGRVMAAALSSSSIRTPVPSPMRAAPARGRKEEEKEKEAAGGATTKRAKSKVTESLLHF